MRPSNKEIEKKFNEAVKLRTDGKYQKSIKILLKLLKDDPDNYFLLNNLAITYQLNNQFFLAENYFNKSINKNTKFVDAYINLSKLKMIEEKNLEALEVLDDCYKNCDEKGQLKILFELAHTNRSMGNFEKSKYYINEIFKIDKYDPFAHKLYSSIQSYKIDDPHIKQLEEIIKLKNDNQSNVDNYYFALGKAYEEINKFDLSAKNYLTGNLLRKKNSKFLLSEFKNLVDSIQSFFSTFDFSKFSVNDNSEKKLIFICGMPRSGTTLAEQIISAHKDVCATGENNYLSKSIFNNYCKNIALDPFEILNDLNLKKNYIVKEYFKSLESKKNFYKVFTDKTYQNFLWIGFIKIFFAKSVVINCKRNPKDVCFSIFKNTFKDIGMNWAYDQKDIATYFNIYSEMINFWEKKLPNFIVSLDYELLISNPEKEIRNLIKNCGLDWDDNCLKYYDNKNVVKTTSSVQVRKRIYTSSKNSYLNYEKYFSEMFDALNL